MFPALAFFITSWDNFFFFFLKRVVKPFFSFFYVLLPFSDVAIKRKIFLSKKQEKPRTLEKLKHVLFYAVELWHLWVTYLVILERVVPNKGSQNIPIQVNFKFRKTYQFSFSITIHKRFDDHHSNLHLKSKSFDLYQRLATKASMPTSSHN